MIGHHDGVVFSTLGERHGFTITKKGPNDGPYYVVGKDIKKNILVVSQAKKVKNFGAFALGDIGQGTHDAKNSLPFSLKIQSTNWISKAPDANKSYTAQIRYHGELLLCKIKILSNNKAEILFYNKASGLPAKTLVAAGQSIVVYDQDVCLGGGIVV